MSRREWLIVAALGTVAAAILAVGTVCLFIRGPLGEAAAGRGTARMAAELAAFFLWTLWFHAREKRGWLRTGGILTGILVFAWLHQAASALLLAGVWLAAVAGMGRLFLRLAAGERQRPLTLENAGGELLMGGGIWITLVCALSAMGVGSIRNLQILAAACGLLAFGVEGAALLRHRDEWLPPRPPRPTGWRRVLLPLLLTMIALQVGRMNVAMDYDSLHYGLRSAYILNNGSGIYENLGNINLVYTYSKGIETLAMPLNFRSSYSFVLAFNVWLTICSLAAAGWVMGLIAGPRVRLEAAAVISCIPGIMNMGITAKSDTATLLFQLLMVGYLVRCALAKEAGERTRYFVFGGCACLFTYVLKPTSLVFSTVSYGAALLFLSVSGRWRLRAGSRSWFCALPVAAAWFGLWLRTLLLTGVPVTSVFTGVFEQMGFRVKAPFAFMELPNQGGGEGLRERLSGLGTRLLHMLAAPVGEDMEHVIIAWGTGLVAVLLAAVCLLCVPGKRRGRPDQRLPSGPSDPAMALLWSIFLPLLAVSVISVGRLWQVDGNYFMLFYALLVILCFALLARNGTSGILKGFGVILAPVLIFNTAVTGLTNWSGHIGFSELRVVHRGYYDHLEENRIRKAIRGNAAIWNILAADPKTRVLAVGDHPDVLLFPCNVQSYYDLTGSGGNVRLVKTLDDFKGFLRYAGIRYLYVQAEYLTEGSREADILRYMIEDGSLADIRYEYGNVIASVNLDGGLEVRPDAAIREFGENYRMKGMEVR